MRGARHSAFVARVPLSLACLESPSLAAVTVPVRATAAAVRRRHAESGALADQTSRSASRSIRRRRSSSTRWRPAAPASRIIPRRPARRRCARRSPDGSCAGTRLPPLDPATQVLPVLGSREALFAFAQTVVDASRVGATVVMPNPFYQIYEGAALLAGAPPYCVNARRPSAASRPPGDDVPDAVWARTQLVYVCSPDNPTGRVTTADEWRLPVRALRPPRLRRSPPTSAIRRSTSTRRSRRSARSPSRTRSGATGFPRLVVLRQPVQALERAGLALGLRRRRRGAHQGLPPLSDLPRLGDVAGGRRGEHRRLERRGARAREPRRVRREVRRAAAAPCHGAALRHARGRVLPWAATPGDDARVRAAAATPSRR